MTESTEPAVAKPGSPHLSRALWAAFWMYGGRACGMVWTLAIVAQLGIADYGKYAMAYAVYSLIGSPLDNVFVVRSVRESEAHFLADRATRYLLGVALMLVGLALLEVNYVAAFGLFVSGGELTLKAWESRPLRDGRPHRAAQIDTGRQFASVVPACIYLFVVPDPTLQTATMILVAPYALVALGVGPMALRHRPGMPGSPRVIAILVGETFSIMAGVQGDLLLLGWLTNDTVAGYYGICTTVTLAIVAVGQTFGMSYNQVLREGEGNVAAGPPLKGTILLGVAAGALVLITGLVMMVVPVVPQELAVAMTIMSLFCGMRTVAMVFQAVLYNQHRDGVRLIANSVIVPVKLGLVLALYGLGAVGAAIASVIGDALLMAIYLRVLYRKPVSEEPAT
ncbi:lipopolysaccharide biosynthesis protein [Mycolicibacterium diernhoferi]|uniref:lipopolysaccharide biosynthesis protein n=1 Tax=Mycolicibacterium diernhoferi TaxID=1801 RepID=UPI001F3501C2|nr:hypothetical protein [Mycolicibacterium diernhoferi]